MLQEFAKLVFLALAVSSISLTISRAKIFKGVREFVAKKDQVLSNLIKCPYCTSHWISFVLTAIYLPQPIPTWIVLDWFVASMAVVAISAILMGFVFQGIASISHKEEE